MAGCDAGWCGVQNNVVKRKDLSEWEREYGGTTADGVARRVINQFRDIPGRQSGELLAGVLHQGSRAAAQDELEQYGTESDEDSGSFNDGVMCSAMTQAVNVPDFSGRFLYSC